MGIIFMVNTDMSMMYKRFMQEEQNNKKRKKKQKENNSESFQELLDKAMQRQYNNYNNKERREVNIMTVIIEYANISPAVLETLVRAACINAFCTYRDIDEEYFEFSVCGWLPLTGADLIAIEGVLAQYV